MRKAKADAFASRAEAGMPEAAPPGFECGLLPQNGPHRRAVAVIRPALSRPRTEKTIRGAAASARGKGGEGPGKLRLNEDLFVRTRKISTPAVRRSEARRFQSRKGAPTRFITSDRGEVFPPAQKSLKGSAAARRQHPLRPEE